MQFLQDWKSYRCKLIQNYNFLAGASLFCSLAKCDILCSEYAFLWGLLANLCCRRLLRYLCACSIPHWNHLWFIVKLCWAGLSYSFCKRVFHLAWSTIPNKSCTLETSITMTCGFVLTQLLPNHFVSCFPQNTTSHMDLRYFSFLHQ